MEGRADRSSVARSLGAGIGRIYPLGLRAAWSGGTGDIFGERENGIGVRGDRLPQLLRSAALIKVMILPKLEATVVAACLKARTPKSAHLVLALRLTAPDCCPERCPKFDC